MNCKFEFIEIEKKNLELAWVIAVPYYFFGADLLSFILAPYMEQLMERGINPWISLIHLIISVGLIVQSFYILI